METGLDSNPADMQLETSTELKPFLVKPKSDEKPRRTTAEVQNLIERRSLELAKAKVEREIALAQSPRYQEMLNHALLELNQKLARLD
ncbi:MAG: hypothetical protein AB7O65_02375 [Candidatus Korobacteraceae bacterium]